MTPPEEPLRFDDSEAYEQFMGRWSRAACPAFLDWLDAPAGARWLDVGCGTGILAQLVQQTRAPSLVCAVDPAPAQVERAARRDAAIAVRYQIADARALPFARASFDVVAAALALNFIPDRDGALREMRRVARAGGWVAAFVWDFAGEASPSGPMRRALRAMGHEVPGVTGASDTALDALRRLLEQAGFDDPETRAIEVTVRFADFGEYWASQTVGRNPAALAVADLAAPARTSLQEAVRQQVTALQDGGISCSARAHAIRARAGAN